MSLLLRCRQLLLSNILALYEFGGASVRIKGFPLFHPRKHVLAFLAQELQNIGSYSTLNTMCSAIALISNNEIGTHHLIKRFCKGASVIKLQKSRYDFIWDPAPVIAKLATLYPYESLQLDVITKKLILLLALGSGQRAQTLAAIKISHIIFSSDKLFIKIPDRIKTSAPGRAQPLLSFSRLVARPELCIISILYCFLSITKNLRQNNCDSLFIACIRPHKPVGPNPTASKRLAAGFAEVWRSAESKTTYSRPIALGTPPHPWPPKKASPLILSSEQQVGRETHECLRHSIIVQ